MPVVLQVLGSLVGIAGLLMIGFGLPIRYTALDNTLIAAGITALVGGLVLVGLGSGLRELRRLLRAIERVGTTAAAEAVQPARSSRVRGPLPMPSAPMPMPKPRAEPRVDPVVAEEEDTFEPQPEPTPPMSAAPLPPMPEPVAGEQRQRPSIFALVRGSRTEHYEIDEAEGVPLSPAITPRAPAAMPPVPERVAAEAEPALEPRFAEPRFEPRPEAPRSETRRASPAALASRTAARIDMPRPVPEVPRAAERPGRNLFDTVWPNEQKREPAFERTPEPPMPEPRPGRGLFMRDNETARERDARDASDLAHAAVKEAFESLSLAEPEETAAAHQEPKLDVRPDPKSTTIQKSGVIDGMAYTLYTDGSIEAQLPSGLMRFASIDDLRTYLERGDSN
jgi:hypothetical protein